MTAMIDTHKMMTGLRAGGMPDAQAECLVVSLNEALAEDVATKKDLDVLEGRLTSKILSSRNMQIIWTVSIVLAAGLVEQFFN